MTDGVPELDASLSSLEQALPALSAAVSALLAKLATQTVPVDLTAEVSRINAVTAALAALTTQANG